jgi:hypothetical protein
MLTGELFCKTKHWRIILKSIMEKEVIGVCGVNGQYVRKADNFTATCKPIVCLHNVGASTSHNRMGLHGLLQGQLYLYSLERIKIPFTKEYKYNVETQSMKILTI